ncbi:MAG: hypothetical protein HOE75_04375, partial [Chloroflexi bacterium]|nr:hypothetical protein [Chloroflexota bacterium]
PTDLVRHTKTQIGAMREAVGPDIDILLDINYNSHLSSFQSLNLVASVSNVRIMESDVDSAPWRDELTTSLPEIKDGYMTVPTGPGWGTDLDEAAAKKYAYKE